MQADLFEPSRGVAEIPTTFSDAQLEDDLQARGSRCGLDLLTETETLALLLSQRCSRDAEPLARTLLRRFGDLQRVLGASTIELQEVLDPGAAVQLKLVHDVARRLLLYPMAKRCVISSWSSLLAYLRVVSAAEPREAFRVLFLDRRNQLIADEVMGFGTIDHAPVYPREVVRRALELNAANLILSHQHPSGDPTPSKADIEITKRVIEAARALGIGVHDHVVVGGDDTTSFKALGLI